MTSNNAHLDLPFHRIHLTWEASPWTFEFLFSISWCTWDASAKPSPTDHLLDVGDKRSCLNLSRDFEKELDVSCSYVNFLTGSFIFICHGRLRDDDMSSPLNGILNGVSSWGAWWSLSSNCSYLSSIACEFYC